ncbi:MAG: YbjQ family protein [Bacillota bacterium]
MDVYTTGVVPGREVVKALGMVKGSTIRARHLGNDIMAGLRNLVGGEVREYSQLLSKAREEALSRMVQEAEGLGADAVVSVRFSTSAVMSGAAEVLVYGTAVKFKDL